MRVNEIFYSLQGEGSFTGTPSMFLRLAGCNLKCGFCDTNHVPYEEVSEDEIVRQIASIGGIKHVVITGGEPTLQITQSLIDSLHDKGYYVQIETNGTIRLKDSLVSRVGGIDFITCSPKFQFCKKADLHIQRIDELKVVYDGNNDLSVYDKIDCKLKYVQPCDVGDKERNKRIISRCVDYCLLHPEWRLSLQTQKIIDVR